VASALAHVKLVERSLQLERSTRVRSAVASVRSLIAVIVFRSDDVARRLPATRATHGRRTVTPCATGCIPNPNPLDDFSWATSRRRCGLLGSGSRRGR